MKATEFIAVDPTPESFGGSSIVFAQAFSAARSPLPQKHMNSNHSRISAINPGGREIIKAINAAQLAAFSVQPGEDEYRLKMELAAKTAVLSRTLFDSVPRWATVKDLAAVDSSDAAGNLGVLAGTLIAPMALEQVAYMDAVVERCFSDFSGQPAMLNQSLNTKITTLLPGMLYDTSVNAESGLVNGWSNATAPQMTDVSIKMGTLIGAPIRVGLDILSSTLLQLQNVFAAAAALTISNYFASLIYPLMTPANFNYYAAVNGALVPVAYPTLTTPITDFGRGSLATLESALDAAKMPQNSRTVLLNGPSASQLANNASIAVFYGIGQDPAILARGEFPVTASFLPFKSAGLGVSNPTPKLFGFAMQRAAIAVAARPTVKLEEAFGGPPTEGGGRTLLVTNERTGLTLSLVEYIGPRAEYAEWRLQGILGAAVGNPAAGICLVTP